MCFCGLYVRKLISIKTLKKIPEQICSGIFFFIELIIIFHCFKVSLRMKTSRAYFRSILSFMNISAITTFPENFSIFHKNAMLQYFMLGNIFQSLKPHMSYLHHICVRYGGYNSTKQYHYPDVKSNLHLIPLPSITESIFGPTL